jgi:gas vesicle protein
VGATTALLLAPAGGEELQKRIQTEAERVRLEMRKAAQERRAELEEQLSLLRAPRKSNRA